MRIPGIPFYQAASTNYTPGREAPVDRICVHHSAGWENTLRYLWADPNRNGSSHFWVGNQPGQIEQYVDTDDTAWCNGNWPSNVRSITIETRGDWRGYYDQQTLDNLETLFVHLRKMYPNAYITYHKVEIDKSRYPGGTACPADLQDKGYAKVEWDQAFAAINPPAPTPTPTAIKYETITPKRIKLIRSSNLWNFNFTDWSKAQAVQPFPAGNLVDVVAIATNSVGGRYYMTSYSYNNGAIRATNGFNVVDCEDYVPQITLPPTVEPKWEAMDPPRKLRVAQPVSVVDLSTMQTQGSIIPVGTDIDIVEKQTMKDSVMYVRSKWARDNNKNWGIRMDHMAEIKPDVPREPIPEPPLDVNPSVPGNSDVVTRLNIIEKILKQITDFLDKIFNKWRP